MPTISNNPGSQGWQSDWYWKNGIQRTLYGHGEVDPYDSLLSISNGDRRKLFLDGYGRAYHSGDKSRINIRTNQINSVMTFSTLFKTGLTSLSLRLRSRVDEPSPNANRFGGYVAVIYTNRIEWYRQDYLGTYTSLAANSTITPNIELDKKQYIKFFCYNIEDDTKVQLQVKIALNETARYKTIATITENTPLTSAMDSPLYRNESYSHIKINGSGPNDILYEDLRIQDLGGDYYKRAVLEKLEVIKTIKASFDIRQEKTFTRTTRFDIE